MSASRKSFSGELRSAADGRAVIFLNAPKSNVSLSERKGLGFTNSSDSAVEDALKYMTVHNLGEPAPLRFVCSGRDDIFKILYLEDYLNFSAESYLALYNEPSCKLEYQLLDVNDNYSPLTLETMNNNEYEVAIRDVHCLKTLHTEEKQIIDGEEWAYVVASTQNLENASRFKIKITRRGL